VTGRALCALVLVSLVAGLALSCNPHRDALPAPRCHHDRHCLPGEECQGGRCEAEATVALEVGGPVASVRALLVAAPRSVTDVATSPHARTLAERGPVALGEGSTATVRFEDVPMLPLYAVVWDGAAPRPCEGTPATVAPLPRGAGQARLALYTHWRGGCLKPPRPLHHSDHLPFRPLRWARSQP
jgi:hypothetical protein